jgi:gliding motility-associated-like protein
MANLLIGQNYSLNGNAVSAGGNCITITPNLLWQNGSVWYTQQLDLTQPFRLEFNMTYGSQDDNGADGMVFVLQTVGPNAIGNQGAGMGFAGFNPSFGIEFDTYNNSDMGDLFPDHVGYQRDGDIQHNGINNLGGPVPARANSANIEDGLSHSVKIEWNPGTQHVDLYFDCALRLSETVDMINAVFNGNTDVYWGFTGSTGGLSNLQMVCLAEEYTFETSGEVTICPGAATTLNANGNPQGTYVWSPSAGLNNPTLQSVDATPALATNYCCTYTDVCGIATTSCVQVNIETPPAVNAGLNDSYCSGDSYTLVGQCNQSDASVQWSTADGNFITTQDALQTNVDAPGTYTLTATSALSSCIGTSDVVISQIPLPQPVIDSLVLKCSYDEAILDIGNTWEAITWVDGSHSSTLTTSGAGNYDVSVTENGCDNSVTFIVNDVVLPDVELGPARSICDGDTATINAGVAVVWNGSYSGVLYDVTNTSDNVAEYELQGCYERDTIHVELQMPPIINLGVDTVFCEGEPFALESTLSGQWQDGSFGPLFSAVNAGDYSIIVQQGPCVVRDSIRLDMRHLPFVDLGYDPVYCLENVYEIGAMTKHADYYIWSTGDSTETIDVGEAIDLQLIVGNVCGTSIDSLHVAFEDCSAFVYLPTAFTPNGDDINDEYWPSVKNVDAFDLNIFDAWGNMVFHSTDTSRPWLGDAAGGGYFVPNGVYNYLASYRTGIGNAFERRGFIQVIR